MSTFHDIRQKVRRVVFLPFYLLTFLLLLTGCSDGKYEVRDGTVYYSYWTFSYGQRYDELPGVDAASFESVKDWLGRDARHVYFKEKLVEGADPATVKAKKYPLFCDAKDYYFKNGALHVADIETFEVLEVYDDISLWAKDSKRVYFDSLHVEGANPATFQVVDTFEGKDDTHVFYMEDILEGADPDTYEVLGIYSKDKSHVWYCGKLMENADAATFHLDKEGMGVDKYGSYMNDERIEN